MYIFFDIFADYTWYISLLWPQVFAHFLFPLLRLRLWVMITWFHIIWLELEHFWERLFNFPFHFRRRFTGENLIKDAQAWVFRRQQRFWLEIFIAIIIFPAAIFISADKDRIRCAFEEVDEAALSHYIIEQLFCHYCESCARLSFALRCCHIIFIWYLSEENILCFGRLCLKQITMLAQLAYRHGADIIS